MNRDFISVHLPLWYVSIKCQNFWFAHIKHKKATHKINFSLTAKKIPKTENPFYECHSTSISSCLFSGLWILHFWQMNSNQSNQNGESILKRIDNRPGPLCNKWCHRRYIILCNISASVPRSSDGLYSGSWNHRVTLAKISKFDPKIIRVISPF